MQEPHLWIISFFSSKSFTHTYTHSPNDYYEIRVTSSITKINGIRIVTWAVNPLTLDQNTLPVAACTRVITRITASPRQIVPAPTSPPPSSSWNDVANTWCHGLSSAVATICNPPANTLFTRSRESSPRRIALERVPHRHVIYSYRSKAPIITHDCTPCYRWFFVINWKHRVCHLANKHYTNGRIKNQERSSLEVTMKQKLARLFRIRTRSLTRVTFLIGSYSRKFATDIADSILPRDVSDARASSSAMSLDAASELSRTDKRPPTYPPPPRLYFSSARSGRYPPPRPSSLPVCRHPCFAQAR